MSADCLGLEHRRHLAKRIEGDTLAFSGRLRCLKVHRSESVEFLQILPVRVVSFPHGDEQSICEYRRYRECETGADFVQGELQEPSVMNIRLHRGVPVQPTYSQC